MTTATGPRTTGRYEYKKIIKISSENHSFRARSRRKDHGAEAATNTGLQKTKSGQSGNLGRTKDLKNGYKNKIIFQVFR